MSSTIITYVSIFLFFILGVYTWVFFYLHSKVKKIENSVVDVFLEKIAKIPALIEVMRPYVVDEKKAFQLMIWLHSEAIIHNYTHIPAIMEHNARINDQYSFLMKLSMAIPEIQKKPYFIYIRDYIIWYDRYMRSNIPEYNRLIRIWNRFIFIKNMTIVGHLLPGREQVEL